jgi:hypothetical protein
VLAFHLYVVCQTLTSALPGQETTRHDKTRQDKSRQDQAKQENTRHDKTMTRQNLTGLKIFLRGLRAFLSWGGMGEGVWRRVERKGVELRLGLETRQDKTRQIKTRQSKRTKHTIRQDKTSPVSRYFFEGFALCCSWGGGAGWV